MQILYAIAVFFFLKAALVPLLVVKAFSALTTKGRHRFVCLFVFCPSLC